jgi:UDP-N-acetylmuramoylalanine--D-glutamate ligase
VVLTAAAGRESAAMRAADVPLLGAFNLYNVMAALAVAHLLGVAPGTAAQAVRAFDALEHRLEVVGTQRGIRFVNASIATVPEATLAHVEVFAATLKTVLLGGHDRGQDFTALCDRLLDCGVETLILFPPAGGRIWETMRERAEQRGGVRGGGRRAPSRFFVATMEEAVRLAYQHTPPGGTCLHSPACASYGLFADYRDRGAQFKRWVRELGDVTGDR